ncbi:gastrokine-1-like [Pogoniulus pusillus]|uniref:gastrokine-1-like n=1 Tax=Pogoniulus pusillus TaxID=488313 RepID=UPI0030B98D36
MKCAIVATVLLGLYLAPALGLVNPDLNQQTTIVVGPQILTLKRQWHVAVIEKKSTVGAWKTVWNYRTGVTATRMPSERVCYISTMNRQLVPTFDALPRLVEQNRIQGVKGQPSQDIIYVIKRPILNLEVYGQEVVTLCSGLTTYETYEVHGPQYTVDQGLCTKINVLHLLDFVFCRANNKA